MLYLVVDTGSRFYSEPYDVFAHLDDAILEADERQCAVYEIGVHHFELVYEWEEDVEEEVVEDVEEEEEEELDEEDYETEEEAVKTITVIPEVWEAS